MNPTRILEALQGVRATAGGWQARCPAHEDRKPSLSVAVGREGQVLLKCHAGCSLENILHALGLEPKDLFLDGDGAHDDPIVATYVYQDEHGAPLFRVLRTAGKRFWQERANGAGWVKGLGDTRRVIYHLDKLQRCKKAVIVEGEKDAEALWAVKLPATTSPMGAGKWRSDYAAQIAAAGIQDVVVIPDNDAPGVAHGQDVARSLTAAGLSVRWCALPEGKDASDYLALKGRAALVVALRDAPVWREASTTPPGTGLPIVRLGDLLNEPEDVLEWLVTDRIAVGSVNLLAGKPKSGKSTAARAMAYSVVTGGEWLGHACHAGAVLYVALEDKRSSVRRHFRQLGAQGDEPLSVLVGHSAPDLLAKLSAAVTAEHYDLVVVDTANRLLRVRDVIDYSEVSAAFEPLLQQARAHGTAWLLLHHAGKTEHAGADNVLGSTAWSGSVDNVLLLNRTERYRVLSSVQRLGPDLPETVIRLDETTGEVVAAGSRYLADVAYAERLLLEAAETAREPQTRDELFGAVEVRRQLKLAGFRNLVTQGRLVGSGEGTKNRPRRYTVSRGVSGEPESGRRENADSGSAVPLIGREPEFSLSLSATATKEIPVPGVCAVPVEVPDDGERF